MNRENPVSLRPVALLNGIRYEVSGLLGIPFTEQIDHRAFRPDMRLLGIWAADCADHVIPFFEEACPDDDRPRHAIRVLREWTITGEFRMAEIRRASLDAHAAAREAPEKDAVFAARAAGQAVATAHVPTHALGCSVYAIRAVAAHTGSADDGIRERSWQLGLLRRRVAERDREGLRR